MGKKKKRSADKVWCYYCEREFDDEKVLVQHQKAKHFKCHACHKKLSTASGMIIHVLQVHKETVTKVPNAKEGRESPAIEIYGMQGIPPDVLAAHYGKEEEEAPSKLHKVNTPTSQYIRGVMPGSLGASYPQANRIPPVFNPVFQMPPSGWQVPPRPQAWFSQNPTVSLPSAPLGVQQPLFPTQTVRPPVLSAMPTVQPSMAVVLPMIPSIPPAVSVSQPLFPVFANNSITSQSAPFMTSLSPNVSLYSQPELNPMSEQLANNTFGGSSYNLPDMQGGAPVTLHSYASGPDTSGPSIGPPPVIANKAPSIQPASKEVYLVWDDEAMSMEERRMSLVKYQVNDETSQMSSIDAAIDKRISASRLAGRMGF
ncbi:protein SUPPRESSOR OF FRI 4-like isoform X2 [Impatiens glandulifera]|uniref:protein SUPPRESSOR OF FRI 4-like isoform X2 n=1 Tax=Impatiens glandulifera TaxID=253017 RepID=UPI001FB14971|nr:protein SUPPRESSOR OF FRI 4-like isoform X2 [Impatiens glandulifera]XP_047319025.1 protein SUPPRESSOR OF FRI 4-like isoform X2 [Impatiens glandulifera]